MLPLKDDSLTVAFFDSSIFLLIGDGEKFLFWVDAWLNGASLSVSYLKLVRAVPKFLRIARSMASALDGNSWIHDIQGALSVPCRPGTPAYKFQIKTKGETCKSRVSARG
jgi:hypothetical protein